MVAPFEVYAKRITRTHSVPISGGRSAVFTSFSLSADGVEQVPPYVSTRYSATVSHSARGPMNAGSSNSQIEGVLATATTIATNLARARFVGELGDTSSFGATFIAERQQTYGMLKSAVVKTFLSARAVRKREFGKAASILGIAPPTIRETVKFRRKKGRKRLYRVKRNRIVLPDGRTTSANAGGYWLWWSYGVKPLMEDCYNAVDVLQRPIPWQEVKAGGKGKQKLQLSNPFRSIVTDCKVKISAQVRLKNPNLWLANQMGLVNPVQIVNEAIMFSFVVDWFSNLSQIIMQMTDFVGLEIAEPMTSMKGTIVYNCVYGNVNDHSWVKDKYSRELSIPSAKLRFAYERFQWQRGANAISLLVQFLKKG